MEGHFRPAKRKFSEGSVNGGTNAKKLRLQILIPKVPVSKEQLQRLQKQSERPKNGPYDNAKKPDVSMLTSTVTPGSSSNKPRESPVAHRLSDLLGGTLPVERHEDNVELSNNEGQTVTDISCVDNKSNNAVQFKNPDSVKVRLFDPEEPPSVCDDSSPLVQEEECDTVTCYPDVVKRTCLQGKEKLNDSSSASYCPEPHVGATPGMEDKNSENDVTEHIDEIQLSNGDAVSDIQKCNSSHCSDVTENQPSSEAFSQETEKAAPDLVSCEGKIETEPARDSLSSSAQDNLIDYASSYNTLEVMNSLLLDLNEERNKREELEGRLTSMEEDNKNLMLEAENLRDVVNDLLHLSKEKAATVSRGTQINMSLSLRRGRTVDRGSSPIGKRDPSPDLEMLHSSVGCQTSRGEVEPPKEVASSFCQTDEDVIPPKILVSAASQTDLCMPTVLWPQQVAAAAALQSAFPTRAQSMALPNVQSTTSVPLQNAPATNLLRAPYAQSAQLHHLPVRMPSQQTSLQTVQQRQASSLTPASAIQHYPAPVSQTGGLPSTGYQSRAVISSHLWTPPVYSASQSTFVSLANLIQSPPVVAHQTHNNQALATVTLSSDLNAMTQRSVMPPSQITNQNLTQVNRSVPHAGRQQLSAQPVETPRSLQIANSLSMFQRRINVVTQNAMQSRIAPTPSLRNTGQSLEHSFSSEVAHQQHLQSLISQPETQVRRHLQTQANPISMSQTSQQAHLNSSIYIQSALNGGNSQPSIAQSVEGRGHVHSNNGFWPRYQQGVNLISFARSVQDLRSQPPVTNEQVHSQRNSSSNSPSVSERRVSLNSSFDHTPVADMPVQQSRPAIGSTQLSAQKKQTLFHNQQGGSLNSSVTQRSAIEGSVQQSLQSSPGAVSVQTHSSGSCDNTMKQFRQVAVERSLAIPRKEETARPSAKGFSLCDEVKRVYNELQQSLDEINRNKQKQRSTSVTTDSSSVIRTGHMASTNQSNKLNNTFVSSSSDTAPKESYSSQACNSYSPNSNQSSPSSGLTTIVGPLQQKQDDSSMEQMDHLSSNKNPCRRPQKTPSGALENAVQKLLALQNNTSSSPANSRCSTPNSVDELFEGTSKEETSVESVQPEIASPGRADVSLTETRLENEPLQQQDSPRHAVKTTSSGAIEVFREKWIPDTLMADTDDSEKAAITSDGTENSAITDPDSVFIAPLTPSKSRSGSDGDKDKNSDELYMYLMSPVIPQISTARRFRERIARSDSSSDDTGSVFATGSSDANGDQDGCTASQNVDDILQDTEGSDQEPKDVSEIEGAGNDVERASDVVDTHGDRDGCAASQNVDNILQDTEGSYPAAKDVSEMEGGGNDLEHTSDTTNTRGGQGGCAASQSVHNTLQVTEGSYPEPKDVSEMEGAGNDVGQACDVADTQYRVQNVHNAGVENLLNEPESEMEQSTTEGDQACEGTETEPKGNFPARQREDRGMETDGDPKQNMETKLADFPLGADNVSDFPPNVVDRTQSSNDGENLGKDVELVQSTADMVPQALTNEEKCNPHVDPEFVRSAVETKETASDGDRDGEGMETEVECSHNTFNGQQLKRVQGMLTGMTVTV